MPRRDDTIGNGDISIDENRQVGRNFNRRLQRGKGESRRRANVLVSTRLTVAPKSNSVMHLSFSWMDVQYVHTNRSLRFG